MQLHLRETEVSSTPRAAPIAQPEDDSRLELLEQGRAADRTWRADQKEAVERRINRSLWIWLPAFMLTTLAVKTFIVWPTRRMLAVPGLTPVETFWIVVQNSSSILVMGLFVLGFNGWARHVRKQAGIHTRGESDPSAVSSDAANTTQDSQEGHRCSVSVP